MENVLKSFEDAWQQGLKPRIEEMLTDCDSDSRPIVLQELLGIELWWRRKAGQQPRPEDYLSRFPDAVNEITAAFAEFNAISASKYPRDVLTDESQGSYPTQQFAATVSSHVNSPSNLTLSFDSGTQSSNAAEVAANQQTSSSTRYSKVRKLGEGAFGAVWLAEDLELKRHVALKEPRPDRLRNAVDIETYLAEARVLASLDHPHIVPVYDVGRTLDGSCYVVSKLIDGADLAEYVKQRAITFAESASLVAQIAQALQHTHNRGLVHRDIKPANILIDGQNQPFVTDFGLALRDEDIGKQAGIAGTPAYMSPEQARGEGHLVDGRSDIFSLGIVLYELLSGTRPFLGDTWGEILQRITAFEATPLRQLNEAIPQELERICMKALSKRATDRYPCAADLAEDLRNWSRPNSADQQSQGPVKIVPKGLRSFDAADSDFFLALLPGPRDRDGLPEVLRFWKTRIEETAPERTFRVGLMYGPSGCGKSSLMKAGLLPRLSDHVIRVFVEASPDQTEPQLLQGLRRACSDLPREASLVDTLAAIRRGKGIPAGRKVVLVLDQFEQWLYSHASERNSELAAALRQCDGGRIQTVLLVRDDFWMPISEFLRTLEVRLLEGDNANAVSLFDLIHARKVLAEFGKAYGRLPENLGQLSRDQDAFLTQSVNGLSQDGKVISVRLALFSDMMKSRSWTPTALTDVGGTTGVGATFLEETFSSRTAPPQHRQHQDAARAVLRALLPSVGTDIKGHMRTASELQVVSGYADRPQDFAELIRILDSEVRLITPVGNERLEGGSEQQPAPSSSDLTLHASHFQLTHDYLVPSLREWLTRKQRETRRGRAELRLQERAATWIAKPETRLLPSLWEYLNIRALTNPRNWTDDERAMMSRANRYHALRSTIATAAMIGVLAVGLTIRSNVVEQRKATQIEGLVGRLVSAEPGQIPTIVTELELAPERAAKTISPLLQPESSTPAAKRSQLHARLASVGRDPSLVEPLLEEFLRCKETYLAPIRELLRPYASVQLAKLETLLRDASANIDQRFRAALALADYVPASDAEFWTDQDLQLICRQLVSSNAEFQPLLRELLQPIKPKLLDDLEAIFADETATAAERVGAANALADYARNDVPRMLKFLLLANGEQYRILFPQIDGQADSAALQPLRDIVGKQPGEDWDEAQRVALGRQRAGAAITLLRLGDRQAPIEALKTYKDMESISQFAARCKDRFVSAADLLALWDEVVRIRQAALGDERPIANRMLYGLLVTLGSYPVESLPLEQQARRVEQLVSLYAKDPSSGVHSATGWLLRKWGRHEAVERIDNMPVPYDPQREWFVMRFDPKVDREGGMLENPEPIYVTFVVFPAGHYQIGSPETGKDHEPFETQLSVKLSRPLAIADRETCWRQYSQADGDSTRQDWASQFNRTLTMTEPSFGVNWNEAVVYCRWLGQVLGRLESEQSYLDPADVEKDPGGNPKYWPLRLDRGGFRLPTDSEWEIACRGGTITPYSFGSDRELLSNYSWHQGNSGNWSKPVGQLPPNSHGLFDMLGNLLEWTHDFSEGSRENDSVDPTGPARGSARCFRGGSWNNSPQNCRTAIRDASDPTIRTGSHGFRVAFSLSSKLAEASKIEGTEPSHAGNK